MKSKSSSNRRSKTVADTGEDRLVAMLIRGLPQTARTLAGPGDDCAVICTGDKSRLTLFKTDALVENIHFTPDTDAARVGWKALCRTVSDVAAMGGEPCEALITLALPPEARVLWVEQLYRGIAKAARQFGCGIAGGETTSTSPGAPVMISVALLGTVRKKHLVSRGGGRSGDAVCVTGRLGGSIHGHHLDFTPRLAEARWLVRNAKPTAMMDLSDGLSKDLPRLADASGVGYRIDSELLPCRTGCSPGQAAGDGEDYELLFTLAPKHLAGLQQKWRRAFPDVPLTCIGVLSEDSSQRTPLRGGWEHFRR